MSDIESTLAATRAAAEAARQANHAAHDAPTSTGNVYDRCAALHELLISTEQLVRVLGERAAQLRDADGLFSDDTTDPAVHAVTGSAALTTAAAAIRVAGQHVNDAWSSLSHLGIDQGPRR